MTKEWICVFSASGLAIVGYVFYKLHNYKVEQEIKRIMFRTENGVNATHYSSVLFVDKESEKFYIVGEEKVYHALDFMGYVLNGTKAQIAVTNKDYNLRLKNKKDVAAFEECCRVLKEIKEKSIATDKDEEE